MVEEEMGLKEGLKIVVYEVSKLDDGAKRQLNAEEIRQAIASNEFRDKFVRGGISRAWQAHITMLKTYQLRHNRQREAEEITWELRAKAKQGFEVYGIPDSKRMVVHGLIVKHDVLEGRQELAYPYYYTVDNVGVENSKLEEKVNERVRALPESPENEQVQRHLVSALALALDDALTTRYVPIAHFLSRIMDLLRELNKEEKNSELIKKLAAEAKKISDLLYPALHVTEKDVDTKSSQARLVAKIFAPAQARNRKAWRETLQGADVKRAKFLEGVNLMFNEGRLKVIKIIQERGCSAEEAIFRAYQPAIKIAVAPAQNEFIKMAYDLAEKALSILHAEETIVLKDAPSREHPFILLLRVDIFDAQFEQLRRDYPNMVGIVIRTGFKHYAVIARQNGFPVLANACTEIDTVRVHTWDAVQGQETAILYVGEGILKVNPTARELALAQEEELKEEAIRRYLARRRKEPVQTQDGVSLDVWVNLDSWRDAEEVAQLNVKGIGLYRTENEYYRSRVDLSLEDWIKMLLHIASQANVEKINVRLVDRKPKKDDKSDDVKDSEFFGESSAGGVEFNLEDEVGRRISLTLTMAIMAVYAISGKMGVMFAMISNPEEWQQALELIEEARSRILDLSQEELADFEDQALAAQG